MDSKQQSNETKGELTPVNPFDTVKRAFSSNAM